MNRGAQAQAPGHVLVGQAGNHPDLKAVATWLSSRGISVRYSSPSVLQADSFAANLLKVSRLHQTSARRTMNAAQRLDIDSSGWQRGFVESLMGKLRGGSSLERIIAPDLRFGPRFAGKIRREFPAAVFVQEGSGLEGLRSCVAHGIPASVHCSSVHYRDANAACDALARHYPAIARHMAAFRYPEWFIQRVEEEHHLATVVEVLSETSKSSFVANGVDPACIVAFPMQPPILDPRRRKVVPRHRSGPLRLVFVGVGTPLKGLLDIASAIESLAHHVELVVVGHVPRFMAAILTSYPNVTLVGKVSSSRVLDFLTDADLFVLPSYVEGYPMAVLEALAVGVPVCISDRVPLESEVRRWRAGLVHGAGDIGGIKGIVETVLSGEQDLESMSSGARALCDALNDGQQDEGLLDITHRLGLSLLPTQSQG